MDSVRFGRVLGTGARLAAQTAVKAVDAATSPNPSAPPQATPSRQTPSAAPGRTTAQRVAHTTARNAAQVRDTSHGIARGSRRFGQAVWAPVVRLSGVLWLELTGVFFGLFALFAAIAAWKLRGNFAWTPTNADAHTHFELALGMALLFSYFAITSFVRANRRGRRR